MSSEISKVIRHSTQFEIDDEVFRKEGVQIRIDYEKTTLVSGNSAFYFVAYMQLEGDESIFESDAYTPAFFINFLAKTTVRNKECYILEGLSKRVFNKVIGCDGNKIDIVIEKTKAIRLISVSVYNTIKEKLFELQSLMESSK